MDFLRIYFNKNRIIIKETFKLASFLTLYNFNFKSNFLNISNQTFFAE